MSNTDLIRRGYHAFNTADMGVLDEVFADDAVWTTPGASSIAGTAHGKGAVFSHFGRYGGETAGTFRAELLDVFEAEDGRVIGLHRNIAQRDERQLDTACCLVFEVANGQIASGTEYFFDLHQWDQFWS